MGCGTQLVKFVIFALNFIFVIGGIGLIAAGALTHMGYNRYLDFLEESLGAYRAPPILLMVVGSVVFVIAFLGCCGAIREHNCMMMTYATFLAFILVVEVGIAVAAGLYKDDFRDFLQDGFRKSIQKYGKDNEQTKAWDVIQHNLECCGITTYKDWSSTTWNSTEYLVPKSCCLPTAPEKCPKDAIVNPAMIYTDGCLDKALKDIGIEWVIIGAGAFAAALLVAIIFACCLAARFRRKVYNSS